EGAADAVRERVRNLAFDVRLERRPNVAERGVGARHERAAGSARAEARTRIAEAGLVDAEVAHQIADIVALTSPAHAARDEGAPPESRVSVEVNAVVYVLHLTEVAGELNAVVRRRRPHEIVEAAFLAAGVGQRDSRDAGSGRNAD